VSLQSKKNKHDMTIKSVGRQMAIGLATATVLIGVSATAHADEGGMKGVLGTQIIINGSGDVAVSGAKVTATSTSGLTASTNIGSTTLTWSVATDVMTKFAGKTKTMANIVIGDVVSFMGRISSATQGGFAVTANTVKDFNFHPAASSTAKVHVEADASSSVKAREDIRGLFGGYFRSFLHLGARSD
jgi:hypothetical protein